MAAYYEAQRRLLIAVYIFSLFDFHFMLKWHLWYHAEVGVHANFSMERKLTHHPSPITYH